jgi:hypothetical protein
MAAALVEKRRRESMTPEFARDGSLQPSHKAVDPGGPRLGPGVADASLGANPFEGSRVFVALIGHTAPAVAPRRAGACDPNGVSFREDAPELPARPCVGKARAKIRLARASC